MLNDIYLVRHIGVLNINMGVYSLFFIWLERELLSFITVFASLIEDWMPAFAVSAVGSYQIQKVVYSGMFFEALNIILYVFTVVA